MDLKIGVIERNDIPRHSTPATVTRAAEFAWLLANRYQARTFVVSRADLALAWDAPGSVNHYYGSPRIEISPEVNVQESYTFEAAAPEAARMNAIAQFDEARASALFERLFARRTRVVRFESPRDAAAAPILSPMQPPAVSQRRAHALDKVLPKPQRAGTPVNAIEPLPGPAPLQTRDAGWGAPLPPREIPAPVTLAAPEIRRVADQVMREIDHRARAQRERTGRAAR